MHKKDVDFCNCITIYKGKREGEEWRGSEMGFSFLYGNGIIAFSRFFMEGYREGWEGG
jgi:hypothetical protein